MIKNCLQWAVVSAAAFSFAGCSSISRPKIAGQDWAEFNTVIKKPANYNYLVHQPAKAGPGEKFPLLLFLHGMGERGTNLGLVAVHGPPKLIKNGMDLPFIVVSPQCPLGEYWNHDALARLVDQVVDKYPVDPTRVYVTGLSMGGYGTWSLITHYPEKFAAAAPICGGGSIVAVAAQNKTKSDELKKLPIWVFHGAKDSVVPLSESELMVKLLERRRGQAKLTVYPDADHDSWTATYNNKELFDWFLSHRRSQ
jgi:predicted peptidase